MHQEAPAAGHDSPGERFAFLDPIPFGLTALVITHHISIAYGGGGSRYYKEAGAAHGLVIALSMLAGVNQAFFMGLFSLMACYQMPPSIVRRASSPTPATAEYRGCARHRVQSMTLPIPRRPPIVANDRQGFRHES